MGLIKPITLLIVLYSIVTCLMIWAGFTAGNDLGYQRGLSAAVTVEYDNGIQDGIGRCLDFIENEREVVRENVVEQWL